MVHNHYGSGAPSGENRVFELECDLLKQNGHQVETFERHSDVLRSRGRLGMIQGALATSWNPVSARAIKNQITQFRPDVVHAHNTFPMISPSIFAAARGCARVLTLHNYRLVCPAAVPMRQGAPCTECIDRRSVLPSIRHGCYRSSQIATLPLATSVALHHWRGTWNRDVEAFIALTEFQRKLMGKAGIDNKNIYIKPNFFPGNPREVPFEQRPARVVYVGRLSAEKGLEDLVKAWLNWGAGAPELRILGDGELRGRLEEQTKEAKNIVLCGHVDPALAENEIGQARLLILPSRWFEGFPMVLREAFALGTPVAVSGIGALPEIALKADGIIFRSGDPNSLLSEVSKRWSNTARLSSMALASKQAFYENYAEQKNIETLVEIYQIAIGRAKGRIG